MAKADDFKILQQAAAHLLLMAEDAPDETADEMRNVAARLQALCVSPMFEPEWPDDRPEVQ